MDTRRQLINELQSTLTERVAELDNMPTTNAKNVERFIMGQRGAYNDVRGLLDDLLLDCDLADEGNDKDSHVR